MKLYEVRIERTTKTVHTIAQKANDEAEAQELAKEMLDATDPIETSSKIIDENVKVREIGGNS